MNAGKLLDDETDYILLLDDLKIDGILWAYDNKGKPTYGTKKLEKGSLIVSPKKWDEVNLELTSLRTDSRAYKVSYKEQKDKVDELEGKLATAHRNLLFKNKEIEEVIKNARCARKQLEEEVKGAEKIIEWQLEKNEKLEKENKELTKQLVNAKYMLITALNKRIDETYTELSRVRHKYRNHLSRITPEEMCHELDSIVNKLTLKDKHLIDFWYSESAEKATHRGTICYVKINGEEVRFSEQIEHGVNPRISRPDMIFLGTTTKENIRHVNNTTTRGVYGVGGMV